jgi:hypothetical protein
MMVNIFEEFKKIEKRYPTEKELATMMQMQREQEGWRTGKDVIKEKESKPMREPKTPTKINDRHGYRWPKRASVRAKQVNRMLKDGVTVDKMAYYLDVNPSQVMSDIKTWDLPQEKNK